MTYSDTDRFPSYDTFCVIITNTVISTKTTNLTVQLALLKSLHHSLVELISTPLTITQLHGYYIMWELQHCNLKKVLVSTCAIEEVTLIKRFNKLDVYSLGLWPSVAKVKVGFLRPVQQPGSYWDWSSRLPLVGVEPTQRWQPMIRCQNLLTH